jgi:adenylate cyclase
MSQSRRLAAILAADVVGYSRIMGMDEEGTLERLKALRRELIDPLIAKHHGRVIKTTGDGLLIEFASAVNAVRCAVEVQQAMPERNTGVLTDRKIELRIGINLGDVVADGDDDLYGDGVNIAARIEALADAGGVFVSGTVYDQVRDRLPLDFEDRGEQQVKNIARPIRVYRVVLDQTASTAGNASPSLGKPSIAVLAFTNMSGDPEQEYFSDGIADDIITELSRMTSFFVIARNSSFTYKGRSVDVRQVARELGVRYVLEGGVRHSRERLRVTAQLVDAEAGNHVWAERYDRSIADIFAVQDQITAAVTGAVGIAITEAEQQRAARKPPESLDAWEAYMRGRWHLSQGKAAHNDRGKEFLEQAIKLDPTFAPAYSNLALAYNMEGTVFGTRAPRDAVNLSAIWARRAIEIDPEDAEAHALLAVEASWTSNLDRNRDRAALAVKFNPNSSTALGFAGSAVLFRGEPARARSMLVSCIRVDPRGPLAPIVKQFICISYYVERDYVNAAEHASLAAARYPEFPLIFRWLAAALGQLGRAEEARAALDKALELSPETFDLYVRYRSPWRSPEEHEHMLDGLRKAGWQG